MPDRTGIFLGWSANLSNFLGLGVEAGASPMYPQKMRVPPLGLHFDQIFLIVKLYFTLSYYYFIAECIKRKRKGGGICSNYDTGI